MRFEGQLLGLAGRLLGAAEWFAEAVATCTPGLLIFRAAGAAALITITLVPIT
jgi:hypothetical protein